MQTFARPMLHCLGEEESKLIKIGILTAQVNLSRLLLDKWINLTDIEIKPEFNRLVCKSNTQSITLLKLLVLHSKKLFTKKSLRDIDKNNRVEALLEELPTVLHKYLSMINFDLKDPHCLKKELPEVAKMIDQKKYLETDISSKKLLGSNKNIRIIFKKLENLKELKKICKKHSIKKR